MIAKKVQDAIYSIELDSKCMVPVGVEKMLSHAELDFPEPSHFRWLMTMRYDNIKNMSFELSGHGTLSPFQNTALLLHRTSQATGEYVKLLPSCHYCPVLIDAHNKLIPLYEFVEVLDGIVDYDKIKEELPGLSYAQIHGSMMFLRKVAQFNTADKDIDDERDEESNFIDELRQAYIDRERTRVLNFNERDDR
jgi:hypothetical protein